MHTPGPWTLETVKTSSGLCHKVGPFPYRRDRQAHACVYVDHPNGSQFDQELEANARLISAAPELLEALEDALTQLEDYEEAISGEKYNSPLINAAIAKAKSS